MGKRIQVKGPLALYRDKPQIVVSNAEQISIVADSQPASGAAKDAARPAVIEAADKAGIDAALPRVVTVQGTVKDVAPADSVTAINFKGTDPTGFYAVVLARNRDAVEKVHAPGLKSIVGKSVQISGKIVEYRGRPEIVVSAPDQIVTLEQ